jgi:amidase
MTTDFSKLSALQTAHQIKSGKISSTDILEFHLAQIDKHNKNFNALSYVAKENAIKQINQLDKEAKSKKFRGRLHGLCFTAKDNIPVTGLPRSDGNPQTFEQQANNNSALVEKLIYEGAVCIGKANMAEYGKSYYSDNPIYGKSHNPFKKDHSPGGSGGGDAAALCLNFSQFGLGADSGGSIRVPANFCGQFALYPTRGVFSTSGLRQIEHTVYSLLHCPGILSKSIEDLELLFSVLKGYDSSDPNSVPHQDFYTYSTNKTGQFAYFSCLNGVKVDSEIKSSLEQCVESLERRGLKAKEITPPAFAEAYEIFIILAGQTGLTIEDKIASISGNPRDLTKEGVLMQNLRKRLSTELPPLSVETLLLAWWRVSSLRKSITSFFNDYDFVLSPVSATQPPQYYTSEYIIDGSSYQSQQVFQFASSVNVLGLPAVAFPTTLSNKGFPLGLQLIGPRFSERFLMNTLQKSGYKSRVELKY